MRAGLEGQFGAPDDGGHLGPIAFRFFAHLVNGTSFFGGAPAMPSYLGAHHKGDPGTSGGLPANIL